MGISNNMGKFKNSGNAAAALMEECAEVIQVLAKMIRFDGSWNEIPPGKSTTRWKELEAEMADVLYQWQRLQEQMGERSIP